LKGGEKMHYFHEIVFTVQLLENVPIDEVQCAIAEQINNAMTHDPDLKEFHHLNSFKFYNFSAPFPIEPDRLYKKDRLYCFNFRTIDLQLALKLKQYLPISKGVFKVISSEIKNHSARYIGELVTLTPIVCTMEKNRTWLQDDGIGVLSERLHINALKKCKRINPTFAEPEEFFFESIELLNQKPIKISYKSKNAIMFGHKVRLVIKPIPWAQQMAFMVLAAGLGEKNSLGNGYCLLRG